MQEWTAEDYKKDREEREKRIARWEELKRDKEKINIVIEYLQNIDFYTIVGNYEIRYSIEYLRRLLDGQYEQ